MSFENLQKFLKEISADADAVLRLKDCHAEGRDAVVAYARELGYEIDGADVEFLQSRMKESAIEMLASTEVDSDGMKSLKSFIKLSGENEEIKNKVAAIGFSDPKAVVDYAKDVGFEFTEKDLEDFGKQLLNKTDELSDDELEKIAGGICTLTIIGAGVVAVFAASVVGAVGVGVGLLVGTASKAFD